MGVTRQRALACAIVMASTLAGGGTAAGAAPAR
jgi:hypothetical protein